MFYVLMCFCVRDAAWALYMLYYKVIHKFMHKLMPIHFLVRFPQQNQPILLYYERSDNFIMLRQTYNQWLPNLPSA